MESFEIFFRDLTPEAQKRYVQFLHKISEEHQLCEDEPITILRQEK
ncbi:MAG TPA: hypothetical protein VMX17_07185 [Candidatus Glassbacteria bacterium]|nr:hypothetical protein [Candidatus Glassbacteria bacterium]